MRDCRSPRCVTSAHIHAMLTPWPPVCTATLCAIWARAEGNVTIVATALLCSVLPLTVYAICTLNARLNDNAPEPSSISVKRADGGATLSAHRPASRPSPCFEHALQTQCDLLCLRNNAHQVFQSFESATNTQYRRVWTWRKRLLHRRATARPRGVRCQGQSLTSDQDSSAACKRPKAPTLHGLEL